jgi:23S rRNA G2445 N2-methylase RlmL
MRYYVTVTGGLEQIACDEVRERAPDAQLVRLERGKVFFETRTPPSELRKLRSVENLHAWAGEFGDITAEGDSLAHIQAQLRQLSLDEAVRSYEQIVGPLPAPSFRITAERTGAHEFNSQEVSAAAGAGVVERYGWKVDLTGHDLEVMVQVRDDRCLVGLRLSDETMSRRSRVEHAYASLKSTVAYCMLRLVGVEPQDVFCDPMCGAGTILVERAQLGPVALLIGGDRDERMLPKARANLEAAGASAQLVRWDARHLPLRRERVSRLLCNLPWGRRVGSHRANVHLYPGFVRQLAAVLQAGGAAALLTQERQLITRLLKRHPLLDIERFWPLSLGGLRPTIYLVRKLVEPKPRRRAEGDADDDH